jgi:hypothetical protein
MNPAYVSLLALLFPTQLRSQQLLIPTQLRSQQHHWVPLIVTEAEEVDIDTATIVSASTSRRAWLRWTFDRAAMRTFSVSPPYHVELVEINCVTLESRVLAATEINAWMDPSLTKQSTPASTTEAAWQMPATGSLFAQVNTAACHWAKAGA